MGFFRDQHKQFFSTNPRSLKNLVKVDEKSMTQPSGKGVFQPPVGVTTWTWKLLQVSFGRLRSSFSARTWLAACFMVQVLIRARDGYNKSVLFMVHFLALPCQVFFFSRFPMLNSEWWRVQASIFNHSEWIGLCRWCVAIFVGRSLPFLENCPDASVVVLFMKRCRVIFPGSFIVYRPFFLRTNTLGFSVRSQT